MSRPGKYSWIALGVGAYLAFLLTLFPGEYGVSMARTGFVATRRYRRDTVVGQRSTWFYPSSYLGLHEIQWRLQPWVLLLARASGQFQTRFAEWTADDRYRGHRSPEITITAICVPVPSLGELQALLPDGELRTR